MNAGQMDRQIVLQTYSTTTDDWNHPVKTWADLATVWASKVDKRETERNELNQTVALTSTTWTIRYRSDIDTTARIKYGTKIYEIRGIKELGRREGLQITTELRE